MGVGSKKPSKVLGVGIALHNARPARSRTSARRQFWDKPQPKPHVAQAVNVSH